MTNDEIIKELSLKFAQVMNEQNDADYQINKKNWTKMVVVMEYLDAEAENLGGKLEPVRLIPKEKHAYIEAYFDVFDLYGEGLEAFIHVLKLVNVFSIEPTNDGRVKVGININNVYEKKPNKT